MKKVYVMRDLLFSGLIGVAETKEIAIKWLMDKDYLTEESYSYTEDGEIFYPLVEKGKDWLLSLSLEEFNNLFAEIYFSIQEEEVICE